MLWGSIAADFNRHPTVTLLERSLGSTVMIETANNRPLLIGFREPPSRYDLDRLLPIWQRNNTLWIGGRETLLPRDNNGKTLQHVGENWLLQSQEAEERLASGDQYRIALGASNALSIHAEQYAGVHASPGLAASNLLSYRSSASVGRVRSRSRCSSCKGQLHLPGWHTLSRHCSHACSCWTNRGRTWTTSQWRAQGDQGSAASSSGLRFTSVGWSGVADRTV